MLRYMRLLCYSGGALDVSLAASASWRSGYAEDCKSLHPGSIPGEASIKSMTYKMAQRAVKTSSVFRQSKLANQFEG
jgi:hypothetical protein